MQIRCKIITLDHGNQDGLMFYDDLMTFNKLTAWVERNCPNPNEIRVCKDQVIAIYDDRAEIYYLKN